MAKDTLSGETSLLGKSNGFATRALRGFFIFFAALLFVTSLAKPVQAQPYASDLTTLRDALNGNAAAIALFDSEAGTYLAVPGYWDWVWGWWVPDQYDPVGPVLRAAISATLGGPAAATVLINNALALDNAALNTLQQKLGGMYAAAWNDPINANPMNATDLVNTIVGGEGNVGLLTLKRALNGNVNATTVLDTLFAPASNASDQLDLFKSGLGITTNAEAITFINNSIAGDPDANYAIRVALSGYNLAQTYLLDSTSQGWLNNLTTTVGGIVAALDTDGDGIPDLTDPDDDNDGIPDTTDTDDTNDGILDATVVDSDGDGTPDATDLDDDNDGIPDATDLDDDGDGIPDSIDKDTDGDGIPDATDTDDDGDGIPDATDTDDDGDGIPDLSDTDSDISGTSSGAACGSETADLTGNFAVDPCNFTRDNRGLLFAQNFAGGEQVVNYLENWWNDEFLPSMKNMTAQLHASVIDQTRQIGSMMDSINLSKAARRTQEFEKQAQERNSPSELTCVAGSHTPAMAQATRTATSVTKGFRYDVATRSANAPGLASQSGTASDQKFRWDQYCTMFHDPDSNGGTSACPAPAVPGTLKNGDIDIEDFLLKDTIDMTKPEEYAAAMAMMRNLVQPKVLDPLPTKVVDSAAGQEAILRREHQEAIRNIAADVVASIISRRSAVPGTTAGPTVKDIRINAGVDAAKISPNPSYNEIMLAMTKERFFDPEYFVRIGDDLGAIKQEQTALNAYVTMQMNDIYRLQEQINALLAARAALKYDAEPKSSRPEYRPLK